MMGLAVQDFVHTDVGINGQFIAGRTPVAATCEKVILGGVAAGYFRPALVILGIVFHQNIIRDACLTVTGVLVSLAMRNLRDTLVLIVHGNFVPIITIVACTIVMLVGTMRNWVDTDFVVVLNFTLIADLCALPASFRVDRAVRDLRAACVILDFHLGRFAVEARPRALLVLAVGDGLHAYVPVLCKVLAVKALEAVAVAVVVAAVGDFRDTGVIVCQHLSCPARVAFALVAVTAFIRACWLVC